MGPESSCHPHPQHGGTFHNKVVYRAAKAAIQLGIPTLRFNFRGVGKSEGEFGEGIGERDDLRAALDYLATHFAGTQVCVMGYSFGAWVGLEVGSGDSRTCALVGIGLPAGSLDLGFLHSAPKPTLMVQGTRDPVAPRAQVEELFASLTAPKQLRWIEGADHFFTGKLDEVQSAIRTFLQETFPEIVQGME
jgi:alpha/beta superfamily hydrolase